MARTQTPYSETMHRTDAPGLIEPRHWSQGWQFAAADEVNGDAVGAGTLICTIPIPIGRVFYLFGYMFATKTAAASALIVQSTLATVGGVEVIQIPIDIAAAGQVIENKKKPLAIISNVGGVGILNCNLYAPNARAAVATNNAITQYFSGELDAQLE